jgi:anti-anti-sigma regulatory factor
VSELQLITSTHRGRLLISLIGPLDHRTAGDLRTHLRQVLAEDSDLPIDLDLRCCTDVSADGLLALDAAQHAARVRGRPLRLVQVPTLIGRLLRKHDLDHLLSETGPRPNTSRGEPDPEDVSLEVPEADAVEQRLTVTDDDDDEDDADRANPIAPLAVVPLEADPVDVAEQHQPVSLGDEHPDEEATASPWVGHHR